MYDAAADTWALVLAAGEGTRLRTLTTSSCGKTVPKQFCSLYEGPSLLHEALARAQSVTTDARTCVVVAQQHHHWWEPSLGSLPAANVIVQPENRGTANGILLPVLHILERDPDAQVVLLPSDHHVRDEGILAASLRKAVEHSRRRSEETVLLGLQPEETDPELGYIVPGRRDGNGLLTVGRFIEKPPFTEARELIRHGALWNAFIIVSSARGLLTLFKEKIPEVVTRMQVAVKGDLHRRSDARATTQLYAALPTIDFSRDILPGQESRLRVLQVPRCGWSDLGTPKRVAEALDRTPRPAAAKQLHKVFGGLSLATQHELLIARSMLQHSV
jgi:mannose-1-phosphate guanylyltransferase